MVTVVGAHAAGELNEVITGGVRDVPGRTMFEKMQYWRPRLTTCGSSC